MNDKGNRYAIAALKDRRATMAGEIVQFKAAIRNREEQLQPLDGTLRLLDPSYWADTIASKRLRRVHLFGGGELCRLIVDALRRAGKPLSNAEVAEAIIVMKGYGHEAMPTLTRRVRASLTYLKRCGRVKKAGERHTARWTNSDATAATQNRNSERITHSHVGMAAALRLWRLRHNTEAVRLQRVVAA